MTSDRDFRQWQNLGQKRVFESHQSRVEKPSDERAAALSEELWSAVLRNGVW
jgi:hypothetical protein